MGSDRCTAPVLPFIPVVGNNIGLMIHPGAEGASHPAPFFRLDSPMDMRHAPVLHDYLTRRSADADLDAEERAHIENFLLDERPPPTGAQLYASYLGTAPVADLSDWQHRHKDFTDDEIHLQMNEPGQPWTFRPDNAVNRLRQIEPHIYLLRVEDAAWPCALSDISPEELRAQIAQFKQGDAKANEFLQGVADKWNAERDRRPLYATTELEVDDIVADDAPGWAERLRDQLGLGHLSPCAERPVIDVVLMRYTVQEVLDSLDHGQGYPAIPTVLDSEMCAYFFPSPIPIDGAAENPYYGHTVNLGPVATENDYRMGVELLHPRITYQPKHFYKMGVIARSFSTGLSQARRFHLPWIRLNSGRDDFGAVLEPRS